MKKFSAKKIAQVLYEETKDLDENQIKLKIKNLLNYLFKNKNLRLVDKILVEFAAYSKKQEGIIDVELFSAYPLNAAQKENLANKLKKVQKVQKINFIEKQDASLLSGLIVKIGDTIYDDSLKTRLEMLRYQLKK